MACVRFALATPLCLTGTLLCLTSCTDELLIAAAPGDIAVGARFRFAAIDSRCDTTGATSFTEGLAAQLAYQAFVTSQGRPALAIPTTSTATSCRKVSIQRITDVTSSDPAAIAVIDNGIDRGIALFELEARAPGAAEVRVTVETARGSNTAVATFRATPVGRVALSANCQPGTDEAYAAIGAISDYDLSLQDAGGRPLLGYGYLPFLPRDVTLAHPSYLDSDGKPVTNFRRLFVTWPQQRGDVTLTSPADASFRKAVSVYDQRAYTAAEFSPKSGTQIDLSNQNGVPISVTTSTADRKSCWYDPIPRRYVTDTPAVCMLSRGLGSPRVTDVSGDSVAVMIPIAAGACRLRAEIPGTAFSLSAELPVR